MEEWIVIVDELLLKKGRRRQMMEGAINRSLLLGSFFSLSLSVMWFMENQSCVRGGLRRRDII